MPPSLCISLSHFHIQYTLRQSSRRPSLALTSTELNSHALLSATRRVRVALLAEILLLHKSAYVYHASHHGYVLRKDKLDRHTKHLHHTGS
jgi:hypothetical protein